MVETIFEYSLKTIESMTKNVTTNVIAAIAILLLAACASPKNVAYIQNSEAFVADSSAFLYEAHIMPKDVLSITVSTINPEISAPFNLVISPTLGNASTGSQTVSSTRALQTYLVSNDGTISFPVLGTLKVGGLSKAECEKLIHDRIIRYLNGKEDPVVTVRMANYKISVLGEVARPGMFTVNNEKINIFEALAQAGDLTIYGVRDRVKLIRENADGKKRIYTMNLNDANIINSPCYYLQQNDIVYVEPNKVKARNSSVGQTTTLWLTSTSILVSVASLLFNILK
jgi:polysaccharide export outer membrane protein